MALARRRGYKTAATGPELLNEEVETVTQRYREGKGEASKWALGGGGGEAGDGSTAGVGGAVLPPGSMRGQRLPSSTELQGDSLVGGGSQTLHANRMHLE